MIPCSKQMKDVVTLSLISSTSDCCSILPSKYVIQPLKAPSIQNSMVGCSSSITMWNISMLCLHLASTVCWSVSSYFWMNVSVSGCGKEFPLWHLSSEKHFEDRTLMRDSKALRLKSTRAAVFWSLLDSTVPGNIHTEGTRFLRFLSWNIYTFCHSIFFLSVFCVVSYSMEVLICHILQVTNYVSLTNTQTHALTQMMWDE